MPRKGKSNTQPNSPATVCPACGSGETGELTLISELQICGEQDGTPYTLVRWHRAQCACGQSFVVKEFANAIQ